MLDFQQMEVGMEYIEILKKTELFNQIEDEKIPFMLECLHASKKEYKKGSFICHEGDDAHFVGIILEGNIQIIQDDYDGKRNITTSFGPGNLFAEAFACANIEKMPVDILAITDCTILTFSIDHAFVEQCEFHHQLIINLLRIVARKNMLLNQKLYIISQNTTRQKLMAYLQQQRRIHQSLEFTIPFDRQALANYLGVERSAMSCEIHKMVEDGLIETNRSHFKLKGDIL